MTELHWLQRHGARYPTSSEGGPREFAKKLQVMNGWKASGELKFLEGWEWSLGAEVLTPFGREQLCKSASRGQEMFSGDSPSSTELMK